MQAVILAGGEAKRISEMGMRNKKPLVHYKGEPIINHVLKYLHQVGIHKPYVIVNINCSEVIDYLKDKSCIIICTKESNKIGPLITLSNIEPYVEGDLLVVACDTIYRSSAVLDFILNHKKGAVTIATATLATKEDVVGISNVVKINNKAVSILEKPSFDEVKSTIVSIPLYILNKDIFSLIDSIKQSERGEYELQSLFQEYIDRGNDIYVYDIPYLSDWSSFITIDTPKQHEQYNEDK